MVGESGIVLQWNILKYFLNNLIRQEIHTVRTKVANMLLGELALE